MRYSFPMLLVLLVSIILPPAFGDSCSDILQDGVFDQYSVTDEEEFHANIVYVAKLTVHERRELLEEKEGSLSLGLEGLLKLSLGSDSDRQLFEDYLMMSERSGEIVVGSNIITSINQRIASPVIANAWVRCIEKDGVRAEILGAINEPGGQFILNLDYRPISATDPDLTVTGIAVVGADATDTGSLKTGAILKPFSGICDVFERKQYSAVSIAVNFDGGYTKTIDLDALPVPSPTIQETVTVTRAVEQYGVWPRTRGDNEMDTDRGDRVQVRGSSELFYHGNTVYLKLSFFCEEDGGDHTTFSGTRTIEIYQAPEGKELIDLTATGGLSRGFSATQVNESHGNYSFPTNQVNQSMWTNLEYRIDGRGSRDDKRVGIGGNLVFDVTLEWLRED